MRHRPRECLNLSFFRRFRGKFATFLLQTLYAHLLKQTSTFTSANSNHFFPWQVIDMGRSIHLIPLDFIRRWIFYPISFSFSTKKLQSSVPFKFFLCVYVFQSHYVIQSMLGYRNWDFSILLFHNHVVSVPVVHNLSSIHKKKTKKENTMTTMIIMWNKNYCGSAQIRWDEARRWDKVLKIIRWYKNFNNNEKWEGIPTNNNKNHVQREEKTIQFHF